MKRAPLWAVVGVGLVMTACKDGSEESGCIANAECAPGYVCDLQSQSCTPSRESCSAPHQCGTNETCSDEGLCRVGDCFFHGCVSGFQCGIVDGRYACVKGSGEASGGAAGVVADETTSAEAGQGGDSASRGQAGAAG